MMLLIVEIALGLCLGQWIYQHLRTMSRASVRVWIGTLAGLWAVLYLLHLILMAAA